MTRDRWYAALALAAVAAAVVWPVTPAVPTTIVVSARVASAVAALLVCAAIAAWKPAGRRSATVVAVLSGAAGLTLLLTHVDARTRCMANYEGRTIVIGTAYTSEAEPYVSRNPLLSPADLLFDAGGDPERVWTTESIRSCTLLVTWVGLAAIPLLVASAGVLMRRRPFTLASPARGAQSPVTAHAPAYAYDAFISYRHLEPDRTIAFDIVETLEREGLRAAIDARDFSPNEHFLSEMERCIKRSRFVLCVITANYVQSGNTSEEAIISHTLDLAERRRRLVPLIYEQVELPVWLYGLVGIDLTPAANVDPRERLLGLLTRRDA
jgi:hypothetical protein